MSDEEHHQSENNFPWIGGVVLILIGLIFLLQNFGLFEIDNWWAVFIMIPAFGALTSAYNLYRQSGNRLSAAARGPLISGVFMILLAFGFLFGLDFSLVWPVVLIIGGFALLLNYWSPGRA